MSVAWGHNPQGEFRSEGQADWIHWCGLGASWFVPVFLVTFVPAAIFAKVFSLILPGARDDS